MDLFTLALAKNISGGGSGGSVSIPDALFQFSVFSYDSTNNKYVWDSTPTKSADGAQLIPVYHDKTRGKLLLPCQMDSDEYADYTYTDTATGTVHYLMAHFESDNITVTEKIHQLIDEIIT